MRIILMLLLLFVINSCGTTPSRSDYEGRLKYATEHAARDCLNGIYDAKTRDYLSYSKGSKEYNICEIRRVDFYLNHKNSQLNQPTIFERAMLKRNSDTSNEIETNTSNGYKPNAYGHGIHSDQYGKPFQWATQDGKVISPNTKVTPNVYGPGVGMDQYGRPVKKKY